jgi:uncharacterized protein (TIGR02145 family)
MNYFKTLPLSMLLIFIWGSCDPKTNTEIPSVLTTTTVSSITQTTAISGGIITSDGGFTVTGRGVCWSTNANPTIADSKTVDGGGIGSFTSSIVGLLPGTVYYARAYATTSNSTTYGSSYQFTTINAIAPTLTTTPGNSISKTTATSGGIITFDGGLAVIVRGVCWSTSEYPTISNSKTADGSGAGSFTSQITGLTENTKYYIRAYATNLVGTTYGLQESFTTIANPVIVSGPNVLDYDGNVYHSITIGLQTWMVENLKTTSYIDGSPISNVTDNIAWSKLRTPAYCWYNNDISNKTTYGALYNWYAINTGKLAPTGWHVATIVEWTTLTSYISSHLGNSLNTSKAFAATTNWSTFSSAGTIGCDLNNNNSSGFSALPGGDRNQYDNGTFNNLGYYGSWWSGTESSLYLANIFGLYYNNNLVSYSDRTSKSNGYSVRCVKD